MATNRPYAGALVPAGHAGSGSAVDALMIEVNRKLYMDEHTGRKLVAAEAAPTVPG